MTKPTTETKNTKKMPEISMKDMKSSAEAASALLKSMSHPDRLMLLCQLTQGEFCVSEIEEKVGLHQPSLSQQLGVLRKDGLVKTRKVSKQVFYSVDNDHAMAILEVLYERFCNSTC